MQISIASGKGGTGKTTIATNLAVALADSGKEVAYLDCDVEEPNGHIFIQPKIERSEVVNVLIPEVDHQVCNFCGKCAEVCEYKAIAVIPQKVIVFPELCHSCGGCQLLCPEDAIKEIPRPVGEVNQGKGKGVYFVEGRINIGEVMAPPVIQAVKKFSPEASVTIVDAPPGTSCPVIEAVKDSDFVILVTEPTLFGLSDLKLAVGMLKRMALPFGVVINCSSSSDKIVEEYCMAEDVDVMLKIPHERAIAEIYSRGEMIIHKNQIYRSKLIGLHEQILSKVSSERIGNPQR